ncbi:hypothetical protein [Rubritalea tangerina]|uniref:hypothetical protein n=1 Tax=Rubritalea tangerina TaxID=430798 RepID=UPI00361B6457
MPRFSGVEMESGQIFDFIRFRVCCGLWDFFEYSCSRWRRVRWILTDLLTGDVEINRKKPQCAWRIEVLGYEKEYD